MFQPTVYLKNGDDLSDYGLDAKVVELPGHTKGSAGIEVEDNLFVGDAYAKDKMASFRFYFLLRALYVDQDTSVHSILSDLNMGQDYFTSQPIIKKLIVEKMLGKDNSELQRIRIAIHCHKRTTEEKILNNATLKKTLSDFISEAQELLAIKRNVLHQNRVEIDSLEKEIQKERKKLFSQSQCERNLIQESINDIKLRLEYLIEKENVLKQ